MSVGVSNQRLMQTNNWKTLRADKKRPEFPSCVCLHPHHRSPETLWILHPESLSSGLCAYWIGCLGRRKHHTVTQTLLKFSDRAHFVSQYNIFHICSKHLNKPDVILDVTHFNFNFSILIFSFLNIIDTKINNKISDSFIVPQRGNSQ